MVGVGEDKFHAIDGATATVEHFADFGARCFNVGGSVQRQQVYVQRFPDTASVMLKIIKAAEEDEHYYKELLDGALIIL